MNVMDYSLVIGIDEEHKDLVLGIIGIKAIWLDWYQILYVHLHGIRNLKAGLKNVALSEEEQKNLQSSPQDNTKIGILFFL